MTVISKAEAALVVAKAKCFKVCGQLGPEVAADRALAAKAHEPHRVALEAAYAAFQAASGPSESHPAAAGTTNLEAILTVDSGLN